MVVLDLGPFGNREAERLEQLLDAAHGDGDRMQATVLLSAAGQGDIDLLAGKPGIQCRGLQLTAACLNCLLHLLLDPVDCLAGRWPFCCS
jgi:hypothetical protein